MTCDSLETWPESLVCLLTNWKYGNCCMMYSTAAPTLLFPRGCSISQKYNKRQSLFEAWWPVWKRMTSCVAQGHFLNTDTRLCDHSQNADHKRWRNPAPHVCSCTGSKYGVHFDRIARVTGPKQRKVSLGVIISAMEDADFSWKCQCLAPFCHRYNEHERWLVAVEKEA